jgi:hypothetical protein
MNALANESDAKRSRNLWAAIFVLAMIAAAIAIDTVHAGVWGSLAIALVPMLFLIPMIRSAERAQVETGGATAAMLRYTRRVTVMTFAYVIALFAAIGITRQMEVQGPFLWILALLPTIPIVGMVIAMGRLLVEETDEYQRLRFLRASVVATGFVLVLSTLWGFLEMFGLVPHLWLWAVFPVWALGLGVGQMVNRWVFGDEGGC